jgi:hypothetical protein
MASTLQLPLDLSQAKVNTKAELIWSFFRGAQGEEKEFAQTGDGKKLRLHYQC